MQPASGLATGSISRRSKGRGQSSEVGRQSPEVGRQSPEVRGQKSEDRGQRSTVRPLRGWSWLVMVVGETVAEMLAASGLDGGGGGLSQRPDV